MTIESWKLQDLRYMGLGTCVCEGITSVTALWTF